MERSGINWRTDNHMPIKNKALLEVITLTILMTSSIKECNALCQQHDSHNRSKEQEKGKIRSKGSKTDSNGPHYEQQSSVNERGKSKQVHHDFCHNNYSSVPAHRHRSGTMMVIVGALQGNVNWKEHAW
eukprot:11626268-Ditylum_brightwellii.AAC.1